jgi:hypothetical protein
MNNAGRALQEQKEDGKKEKNDPAVDDVLQKLLSGEQILETIQTKRGTFTMKYPRPRVTQQIVVLLAQRFEGVNLGNLPEQMVANYRVYATLDIVVVKAPKWWDDLDSSLDCPDDKFILDLYRRYLQFYNRVQSEIEGPKPEPRKDATPGAGDGKEAPVDPGAFSTIALGQEVPEPERGAD